jgi:multidrug efflux pump subunit AcrA (membrane-fusion protein)
VDQARRARDSDQASVAHKGLIAPAEVDLGYAQIKAPFDGIVIAHFVSVGEPVGTSGQAKLATLVQIILPDFHLSEQMCCVSAPVMTSALAIAPSLAPMQNTVTRDSTYRPVTLPTGQARYYDPAFMIAILTSEIGPVVGKLLRECRTPRSS